MTGLLVFCLLAAQPAPPTPTVQPDIQTLMQRYREHALRIQLSGLRFQATFFRGDERIELGFLGWGIGDLFSRSAEAYAEARLFAIVRSIGMALVVGGIAGVVYDLSTRNGELSWVSLASINGAGLGTALVEIAPMFLYDAVALRNQDLAAEISR